MNERFGWVAAVRNAVLLVVVTSCTLENSTNDDPDGNRPSNSYRDAPSERSEALWTNPGDNLLSTLVEVEQNDKNVVLSGNNRVLGSLLGETGAYFSAITAYTPFGAAFELQSEECENSRLPDAVEELCTRIEAAPPDPEDAEQEDEAEVTGADAGAENDNAIQLVIVNDLQHAAFERTLMRKLLSCARDLGFTHLAVEALQEDGSALEARGYVSRSQSGVYTREPQMAGLLEDGLRLGYDIVSYDVADRCTDCAYVDALTQYSDQQAANIVAETFDVDPEAKVLVFAGARQSYKRIWGPREPYTTSLGARLWERTGIEPYSIDQVAIDLPAMPFGASDPNPPSGMYMASGPFNGQCMGSYTPDSPTGLGTLNSVIVHVPPRSDVDRWGWLHAEEDERRTITASCSSCSAGQRLFVQAYPQGLDRTDRVAVDQALCAAGSPCQMVLPAGAYQLVVWSETALVGTADVDLATTTAASASW